MTKVIIFYLCGNKGIIPDGFQSRKRIRRTSAGRRTAAGAGRGSDPPHERLRGPFHHFPDTSDEYAGIDSKILLSRVVAMIRDRGWEIVNVDNTLLAQKPKIAPFVPRMRQTLADVMGIPVEAVSVKATTTERLGFTGREEGIAAYATCLLRENR